MFGNTTHPTKRLAIQRAFHISADYYAHQTAEKRTEKLLAQIEARALPTSELTTSLAHADPTTADLIRSVIHYRETGHVSQRATQPLQLMQQIVQEEK